jgi:hypothetical protein
MKVRKRIRTALPMELIERSPVSILPGWRRWYDVYFYAGWRIQKNELKELYRTISPTGNMWERPTEKACMKLIEARKEKGLRPHNDHLVIIIPGLNGLLRTFSAIENGLRDNGYETFLWNFASNRADARGHAQRLHDIIGRLEDINKISFVTHSLGGLILRTLLSEENNWHDKFELGEIVMIAPPHGGSFFADIIRDTPELEGLYQWVCGRVGEDLTTRGASELPPLSVPVGIIIGGTGNKLGFNPLANRDNDIVVSRDSSNVDLAVDSVQIKGSHTLMLWNKQTVEHTLHFIEHGRFKG